MPDLGTYAFEILMSYAISLALLAALVAASWMQARRVKALLQKVENNG